SATDGRPASLGRLVPRPRLAGRIGDALADGSLIVTAGAGFGKTTALEQALTRASGPVAFIGCSDAERVPGTLLLRMVDAIALAVPGASAALGEKLTAGLEPIDARAGTRELIVELSRLLIEPLILVIDDAEHLEGAGGSERLVAELIRAELP